MHRIPTDSFLYSLEILGVVDLVGVGYWQKIHKSWNPEKGYQISLRSWFVLLSILHYSSVPSQSLPSVLVGW